MRARRGASSHQLAGMPLLRQPERQQHIPLPADEAAGTGGYIHHPIDDDGAGRIYAAAVGFDAVDGVEIAVCVERPEERAIFGGVGAQSAVHAGIQHRAGDGREGTALAGAAAAGGATELREWGLLPDKRAFSSRQRAHAAGGWCQEVGDTDIDVLRVDRDAPLATQPTTLAETVLPHGGAFLGGIEC